MALFASFDSTVSAIDNSTTHIVPEAGISVFSEITKLFESCPDEFVTFVHGWGNNDNLAKERLDRIKLSLGKE